MDMNLSKLQEKVNDTGVWCAAVHWVAKRHNLANSNSNQFMWYIRSSENHYKIQGDLFLFIGSIEIAAVKVTPGSGRLLAYISPEPHPDPGSRSLMPLICGSDFTKTSLTES